MITDWRGLYSDSWKDEIVPEAFAHPAKYARGLIRRIYDHCLEEGWLQAGDTVLDPFGGVGLGGLDAMARGVNWIGVELEQKFVDLGRQNIARFEFRLRGREHGQAALLQGDSRYLDKVLSGEYQGMVSSPPFGDSVVCQDPNYSTGRINGGGPLHGAYGSTPGNLGNMKAAVSSPPYSSEALGNGEGPRTTNAPHTKPGTPNSHRYGSTPGQLGAMRASVSSPPYEGTQQAQSKEYWDKKKVKLPDLKLSGHSGYSDLYNSSNPGNLGGNSGNDFWSAARLIVDQVYSLLAPGAHSIWVVKSFVKNKQIVDFPGQWQATCEAAGFHTIHIHRAWLVEEKGTQLDFSGNGHKKKTERKSFFRRLAEIKGSPRIDYEIVLCMVK